MNTAIQTGQEKTLRDLYMIADRARGPEGYILAYDNAYKIGGPRLPDSPLPRSSRAATRARRSS